MPLACLDGPQGARVVVDGRAVLMFGSNDYLGLANHPEVVRRACAALERYGCGTAMNQPLATTPVHLALAERISKFCGTEDALLFNSAASANAAVLTALAGLGDTILSDRLNHATIIDGCRLSRAATRVYAHDDAEDLRVQLRSTSPGRRLVVTDGVFSMEGNVVRLGPLAAAARSAGALVVVDEAHAAGVIGPGGRGTAAHRGAPGAVDLFTGTFSKAFGAAGGGYVAGSRDAIAETRSRARSFIFSSGPSPSVAAAALAALDLVIADPGLVKRLGANTARLRRGLADLGLPLLGGDSAIVPIVLGDEDRTREVGEWLLASGVFIPALAYPVVAKGAARLRAQASASHSPADIDEALGRIEQAMRHVPSRNGD